MKPHLPSPDNRGFTGIKYYRITGGAGEKEIYQRDAALQAATDHAGHFLNERVKQVQRLAGLLDRPPIVVAPYDAELFGHWWYEGPEFLDYFARKLFYDQKTVALITPGEYLRRHPTNQIATPGASSWGEEGYWRAWLNEKNEWIYPHLQVAQERMTDLAQKFPAATGLKARALRQAARELLLAQASDWPFILRAGTSPDYARRRVKDHLLRFIALHDQLTATKRGRKMAARNRIARQPFPRRGLELLEVTGESVRRTTIRGRQPDRALSPQGLWQPAKAREGLSIALPVQFCLHKPDAGRPFPPTFPDSCRFGRGISEWSLQEF